MKYIADKTLLVASNLDNKHLKEVDAKIEKSINGYFNKCTDKVNDILFDVYKMLDVSTTAEEFKISIYNGHFHVNDVSIGITINNTDKFFFTTKISRYNLRRLALLIHQFNLYVLHISINKAQTLMKLVGTDKATILIAMKN